MITREEYEALNAKLDMYIQCQNKREKDFNELERKVYRLEQGQQSNVMQGQSDAEHFERVVAWLR